MNVKEYCMEMNDPAMSRRESKKLMFRRHAEEQYRERVRTGYCQFDRDDIQVDPDAPVSMTTDDEDTRGAGAWVQGWVWVPAPHNGEGNE